MFFIGIDTSCYTTSVAAVKANGDIVYDGRLVLKVAEGSKGLRQSDAVFQHNANLSILIEELCNTIDPSNIKGIGVSSKPRNMTDSYMPVFTAGKNAATIISSCLRLPIIETSHQQGHIAAGLWSAKAELHKNFLVYHVSGGTSELLHVKDVDAAEVDIVGGSSDLNAGQFVDRIGVALGFSFPSGQQMDKLCCSYEAQGIDIPLSVEGSYLSFSGPESHVQRFINKAKAEKALDIGTKAAIAKGVFDCIGSSLEKTISNAAQGLGMNNILIVGGVASNSIIRRRLLESNILQRKGLKLCFSAAEYSSDNAVGAALICRKQCGGTNEHK